MTRISEECRRMFLSQVQILSGYSHGVRYKRQIDRAIARSNAGLPGFTLDERIRPGVYGKEHRLG